ncbi:holo-ACP synthase [Sulfoacidibacillus ferrooxidans]|uniref:Holo-[acyl-carrier-protein] synthase n=1 Tax=Sulfoacidibacillus ferrooxidans TaxID=2005001 RepID=A0A9X1V5R2_9BACL|nr:holo-ACP synthase [Sulfoacidibacillus ferrooxidans]MCI0181833.1 Holo-[acyl-carrier-protein] synthase [Sulfoacidibacillus ferrooxidans]
MVTGVDIVEIARIGRLSLRPRFCERIYTHHEYALTQHVTLTRRNELLAGRFAVKEAVIKALYSIDANRMCSAQSREKGIAFLEIETLSHASGAPCLLLHGQAQQVAQSYQLTQFHVSLSHTKELAIAFVVLT